MKVAEKVSLQAVKMSHSPIVYSIITAIDTRIALLLYCKKILNKHKIMQDITAVFYIPCISSHAFEVELPFHISYENKGVTYHYRKAYHR